MPSLVESAHVSDHIQNKHLHRTVRTNTFLLITLAGMVLVLAGVVWQMHRSQPITTEQRQQLTLLADSAAERSGKTRQKVWSELKITLNIRRIQDITQKDFDRATEWLLQEAK